MTFTQILDKIVNNKHLNAIENVVQKMVQDIKAGEELDEKIKKVDPLNTK